MTRVNRSFSTKTNAATAPQQEGGCCHLANSNSKIQTKHPLEWFIGILLLCTFIATSIAAYYTRKQWLTADDAEKRDLRAYVYLEAQEDKFPKDSTPNRYAISLKITNSGKNVGQESHYCEASRDAYSEWTF
jgi:hypothetical protein